MAIAEKRAVPIDRLAVVLVVGTAILESYFERRNRLLAENKRAREAQKGWKVLFPQSREIVNFKKMPFHRG